MCWTLARPLAHIVPLVGHSGFPSMPVMVLPSTVTRTPQPLWQLTQQLLIILFSLATINLAFYHSGGFKYLVACPRNGILVRITQRLLWSSPLNARKLYMYSPGMSIYLPQEVVKWFRPGMAGGYPLPGVSP